MTRKRRGLTLIEILVVIGIMIVLLAIILPVFTRARAMAEETPIPLTMRQLVASQVLYAQDNNDMFAMSNELFVGSWQNQIEPYFPGVQTTFAPGFSPQQNLFGEHHTGYSMNSCVGSMPSSTFSGSSTVLVGEAQERAYEQGGAHGSLAVFTIVDIDERDIKIKADGLTLYPLGPFGSNRRHGGGYYGAVDGRVVWARPEQVAKPPLECFVTPTKGNIPQFGAIPIEMFRKN